MLFGCWSDTGWVKKNHVIFLSGYRHYSFDNSSLKEKEVFKIQLINFALPTYPPVEIPLPCTGDINTTDLTIEDRKRRGVWDCPALVNRWMRSNHAKSCSFQMTSLAVVLKIMWKKYKD